MPVMTTGDAIAESLVSHGVDTVFGIPGAHTYDLIDALARRGKQLRFIATRHEQGAAYMAYGYAKATGRIGVFTVVPGPGVLNAGAALCTAYGATTPLLCLTGNIQAHLIGQGRGQLHELPDQLALLRGLTKWSERINHPTEAGAVMAEAFRQLRSGRVRPVAVETPWNVFGMSAEVMPVAPAFVPAPPPPDPAALAAAARLIAAARQPLIMVGAGALNAAGPVLELARLLQAPVTAHRSGKGVVGEDRPYGMSPVAAWEYWRNCDLLLGIGSRLELQYLRWRWFPKSLRVVRIDIDPTEMVRLRPEVGLVTDAAVGARALIEALKPLVGVRPSREAEYEEIKQRAHQAIQMVKPQVEYLEVIRELLPRDGYFCEEISQVGFAARFAFPVYESRQYLTCGYQDNLGFGFNTALGAKVAWPDRPVVAVSGDGGFLFGVQELATAVQYAINLVCIVFNNSGYGNVRRDQQEKYAGRYLGVELRNPDFCALAESFGALGLRAGSPAELRPVLRRALAERRPVIVEVACPPGSETTPWSFLHPAPPA